jgi:hypothetical protein
MDKGHILGTFFRQDVPSSVERCATLLNLHFSCAEILAGMKWALVVKDHAKWGLGYFCPLATRDFFFLAEISVISPKTGNLATLKEMVQPLKNGSI